MNSCIRAVQFTDDTVMTCAVAQALMDSREDFSDLSEKAVAAMQRIGRMFPDCGYGARFIHWMFSDDPQPYNSCGNGSAMRISPVGFAARDVEEAKRLSAAVTRVSHNHPEGMKGAEATAVAIVLARQGKSKAEIRAAMEEYYDLGMTVEEHRTRVAGTRQGDLSGDAAPGACLLPGGRELRGRDPQLHLHRRRQRHDRRHCRGHRGGVLWRAARWKMKGNCLCRWIRFSQRL